MIKLLITFLLTIILTTDSMLAFQKPEFILTDFFGKKGSEPGMMLTPEGIAVDVAGNIYIADTGNNRILKLTSKGELLKHYGGFGWEEDQFDAPVSISAVGLDVYVVDKNNHRLMRFDRELNFISALSLDQTTEAEYSFQYPAAGGVSHMMDKFIIDTENKRIVKFNAFDKSESSFGGYGSTGQPLINPVNIAVSGTERVYVSDPGLGGIVLFDYFGNFMSLYGENLLKSPDDLCIGTDKALYVVDTEFNSVFLFDEHGRVAGKLENSRFTGLTGIATHDNQVYVLDGAASKIYVFRIENR